MVKLFAKLRRIFRPSSAERALAAAQNGDTALPRELRGQAVPVGYNPNYFNVSWNEKLTNPADENTQKLQTKTGVTTPYDFFLRQYRRDGHLRGVVSQRIGALLRAPASVQPAGEDEPAVKQAALFEAALENMQKWEATRRALAMAGFFGKAVGEVLWDWTDLELNDGLIASISPVQIPSIHPQWFIYSAEGEFRLLTNAEPIKGEPVPDRKFLDYSPETIWDNLYGEAWGEFAGWWSWFKRNEVSWWLVFSEKYASPTLYAERDKDTALSDAEEKSLKKMVTSIQQQTGLIPPRGVLMKLLEAQRSGTITTYETFCEFCNSEMSKGIIGETLTADQDTTGSHAMASVHLGVRDDLVAQDSEALCELINTTLLRWFIDLNIPEGQRRYPKYVIDTDPPVDANASMDRFQKAQDLNVDLSLKQVRDEGNLDTPEDEADTLSKPEPPPSPFELLEPPGHEDEDPEPGRKPAAAGLRGAVLLNPLSTGCRDQLLSAGSRDQLPAKRELRDLFDGGVAALSSTLAPIAGIVRDWFMAEITERGLGADSPLDFGPDHLDWATIEIPDEMRAAFVDRLNDDLTIAQIIARERFIRQGEAQACLKARPPLQAAADDPLPNPNVEMLFGEERLVPRRVLSVLNRKVRDSLSFETFYKLDALSRSSSFTAWDLTMGDVRHIGGALQDAANWGYTCQQFADYLYDRLEARYVQQGTAMHAWHVETIYHTNLSTAYNQAQADQLWEMQDTFDYVRFINPAPQAACCVERAGKVYRTDGGFLRGNCPPLHFNCASTIAAIPREMVEREGWSVEQSLPLTPPEMYAGPKDPQTGKAVGTSAPFGAWAPMSERYEHLELQRGADNA